MGTTDQVAQNSKLSMMALMVGLATTIVVVHVFIKLGVFLLFFLNTSKLQGLSPVWV
jgi:hypothetical protein